MYSKRQNKLHMENIISMFGQSRLGVGYKQDYSIGYTQCALYKD